MKGLYIFISVILMNACTKHEEVIDTSFQVGNVLCSDGSVIHPTQLKNGQIPIGIVFWCNDGNDATIKELGYAVALEDLPEAELIKTDEDISNVSESETKFDGAANTAAIIAFALKDNIPFQAVHNTVEYAPQGVTGWFVPSAAQTKVLSHNMNKVYASMRVMNGTEFSGWYWTSTEDGSGKDSPKRFALIVSLQEGRITVSNKFNAHKVRPIISIR